MKSFPMEQVSSEDTRTELVCGIARTTLMYFRDLMGEEAVRDVVSASCMNYEYLVDDRNWMSMSYFCGLLDELVQRSGKTGAAFEAGQYGARHDCMGLVRTLTAGVSTPGAAYRFWVDSSSHWNRVADWAIQGMGRDHCRVSMTLHPGHANTKSNCQVIQGLLTTLPRLWNLPPARVTEAQCSCSGSTSCIYDVRWTNPSPVRWPLYGVLSGGLIGAMLYSLDMISGSCAVSFSGIGLAVGFAIHYLLLSNMLKGQNSEQILSLENTVRQIEQLNEQLQQKVELRTTELAKALEDLKASREKEVVTARHAAIGVLAAGMAHELNNPLNAVAISLQGIREDIPEWGETYELVRSADVATRRCRRIVAELLAYSRDSNCRLADVADIVSSTVSTFQAEQSDTLTMDFDIASSLPPVSVDRGQIQQAVMNLLDNAAQAMGGKGRITVAVRCDKEYVVISVRDTGPGMNEETRKRIFDPFFTTKPRGKGLGLGLAITWQLVQRNGGTIDVNSRDGQGSEFMLRLPLSPAMGEEKKE